jgi:hypothetical protein
VASGDALHKGHDAREQNAAKIVDRRTSPDGGYKERSTRLKHAFAYSSSLLAANPTTMAAVEQSLAPTNGNGVHVDGNGIDGSAPATVTSSFDTSLLHNYLLSLLPPLFGAAPDDLWEIFEGEGFDEYAARFATEGNGALYISKIRQEMEGKHYMQSLLPIRV